MKKNQIMKDADKVIKYLSKEYLELHSNIQRFAEPNILIKGFYTFTLSNEENKTKVFISR